MLLLTGLTARAEPPPLLAEEVPLEDRGHRFRWGVSAGAGSVVGLGGLSMLAEFRLGYQRSRTFSITGTFSAGGNTPADAYVTGRLLNFGTIAEFTFFDWLYFGGGLVVSNGGLNSNFNPGPDGLYSINEWGWRPGLDLRVGFSAAASHPPTFNRGGFNIGVQALLLLHPAATLSWAARPGQQNVTTTQQAYVSFTPVIMLGYDSR